MMHELKIWPEYFELVATGHKTVELRREDDRQFAVGDVLELREWDLQRLPEAVRRFWSGLFQLSDEVRFRFEPQGYTGRECRVQVTHVLRDPEGRWLQSGVVALSIGLWAHSSSMEGSSL